MYVCMYVCTRWRLPDRTCKAFLVRCGVDRDSCASKPRGANRSTNVNPARFFFCSCDLQVERGQRASKDKRLLRSRASSECTGKGGTRVNITPYSSRGHSPPGEGHQGNNRRPAYPRSALQVWTNVQTAPYNEQTHIINERGSNERENSTT